MWGHGSIACFYVWLCSHQLLKVPSCVCSPTFQRFAIKSNAHLEQMAKQGWSLAMFWIGCGRCCSIRSQVNMLIVLVCHSLDREQFWAPFVERFCGNLLCSC